MSTRQPGFMEGIRGNDENDCMGFQLGDRYPIPLSRWMASLAEDLAIIRVPMILRRGPVSGRGDARPGGDLQQLLYRRRSCALVQGRGVSLLPKGSGPPRGFGPRRQIAVPDQ